MTGNDGIERDLRAWFADTAAPRMPEYVTEILLETTGAVQRPRWSFPERWLPMSVATLGLSVPKVPWRFAGVLAVVASLVAISLGTVGRSTPSLPSLPAPFGLAGNGLIAFSVGGDIHVADPLTGEERVLVAGPEVDSEPRWSLDGTRLAFLREADSGAKVVVVDGGGRLVTVSADPVLHGVDSDTLAWSPDGRTVGVAGSLGTFGSGVGIVLIDANDGRVSTLDVDHDGMEFAWRPPDGRQIAFLGRQDDVPGLYVVSLDDRSIQHLAGTTDGAVRLRPIGWTSDGTRFLYDRDGAGEQRTYVVDPETGLDVPLNLAFGKPSNDGSRVAGLALGSESRLCLMSIGGGSCPSVGTIQVVPDWGASAALSWSPDDRWLLTGPGSSDRAVITEVDGDGQREWWADGNPAWQRIAP